MEKEFRPLGVIFDMDGILFDTENLTMPMWNTAGKPFGYNITTDVVLRMVGASGERCKEIMQEEYGQDFPYDDVRGAFRKIVREEIERNGVPKKPGLDFLLERLEKAKIPFALATSTRKESAHFMLKKAGIFEKFAATVCGDEIKNGKPAPDIFLLAAEKMGCQPSACAGFEDSTAGLKSLYAAGIRSIFIKDVVQPPEEVLATVWKRCGDLTEAAGVLGIGEG
jgi:HAD superfamily hydrolase (TIGR01509 family)